MKMTIFSSTTLFESAKAMMRAIESEDMTVGHYIVVPDRYSIVAEKMLFAQSKKESFFNVDVVGVSTFASKILEEEGINFQTITASESLLLADLAIKNVQNDLRALRKTNISFVGEVSKTIMQLKSSAISPEELIDCTLLISGRNKFNDLSKIYGEYDRLAGEKVDASKLLSLAKEALHNGEKKLNKKIYFAFFDSFTEQVFDLIQVLTASCLEVQFALARPSSLGNAYIYEDDVHKKLSLIAQKNSVKIEVKSFEPSFNEKQKAVAQNIFSPVCTAYSNDGYFSQMPAQSRYSSVNAVAKIIKYMVYHGTRYRDFSVVCSDERYFPLIENIFEEAGVPAFIDQSVTADKSLIANAIFKVFEVASTGYSKDSVEGLLSNLLFEINDREELVSIAERVGVQGKGKFKKYISPNIPEIDMLIDEICDCKTVEGLCDCAEKVLSLASGQFEKMQEYSAEQGFLKERNINEQISEVVCESLEIIKKYKSGEIKLKEFVSMLKLLLSYRQVLSVPAYLDAVFVGDANESSFDECKYYFVLGSESLPSAVSDNGLITDDDINFSTLKNRLSPTIRMINRRNRFKLFSLLTLAKEKLFVSFLTTNDEGKKNEIPTFLENLISVFGENEMPSSVFERLNDYMSDQRFLLALGWKGKALQMMSQNHMQGEKISSLEKILGFDIQKFDLQREKLSFEQEKLFFPNNKTKVSQIECYFSCPFKHFVRYGLKLKEYEKPQFDARDIGNICHKMAELFVKEKLPKPERVFVEKNFYKVLFQENLQEKFEEAEAREALENFIKSQSQTILERISYELSQSQFKPVFVEKNLEGACLSVNGKRIDLAGKVDRIDEAGDYFRIIDYKTGKVGGVIKDLYYGDKLQLFVYQKAVGQMLGKASAGALYFDCKWDYAEEGEDKSILKGIISNDEEAIAKFDNAIEVKGKSDIVSIALSSAKSKKGMFKGSAISKLPLSVYENYAQTICEKALAEMEEGYILPKPDESSCSACKYLGICLQGKNKGVRKKERIGQNDFSSFKGGENA